MSNSPNASSKIAASPPDTPQPLKILKKRKALALYSAMDFHDPFGEDVRSRLPCLRRVSEQYKAEENKRKRNVSDSSLESVCDQFTDCRESELSVLEFNNKFEEKLKKRIDARISLVELHLEQRNEELQLLVRNWKELKWQQYVKNRDCVEGQIKQISMELIALKRKKNTFRGKIIDSIDDYRKRKDADTVIDQLMESMVTTYQFPPASHTFIPEGARKKRKSSSQSNFRRTLIQYYAAHSPTEEDEEFSERRIWCPILKNYVQPLLVKAAHIVPHAIGEINCAYLFNEEGAGTGHLLSAKNGILMHHKIEEAMDKAQLAIVPVDDGNPGTELKVVVFDESLLKKNPQVIEFDWSSLDGLRLEFKNENRPGLRYLYFQYLMTLFRRRRYECTGWQSDLKKYANQKMWASPGKWLRGSSVRALARRIGYEQNLETFLDTKDLPLAEKIEYVDDILLTEEVVTAYDKQKEKEVDEHEDSEDSEDNDEEEDDDDDDDDDKECRG